MRLAAINAPVAVKRRVVDPVYTANMFPVLLQFSVEPMMEKQVVAEIRCRGINENTTRSVCKVVGWSYALLSSIAGQRESATVIHKD
jgi:hypothetical protein